MAHSLKRYQFRTQQQGLSRAKPRYECRSCEAYCETDARPTYCTTCGSDKFYKFDSKIEYKRFCELKLMQKTGRISNLETQVCFPLKVNGVKIFPRGYYADFMYTRDGKKIVEDVKPMRDEAITEISKVKIKLVGALYGIKVDIIQRR